MLNKGEIVGEHYRVLETLGTGGMGTTWAAEDTRTGQRVAIKALSLKSMTDWKTLELFEREAQVLKHIDHPNIPRYIDTINLHDEAGDAFCLVQELVEGQSLDQRTAGGWRPEETEVRGIARSLLETLAYLHERNPPVIHRDVKPQNIIVRPEGGLALVDFGAVKDTARREGSFASTVVGTYGYMAPEQFRGHAVPSSDLYALGATLIFILTHRDPSELPQKRLKIDFRDATQISPRFADWLDSILEPAPEDRIASAREAIALLDRLDDKPTLPEMPFEMPSMGEVIIGEPPAGSRIKVRTQGDKLIIDLPAAGIRAMTPQNIFTAVFMVFWLSFIAVWTALALVTIVMALFSIPFWLIGFAMLWRVLNSFIGSQRLTIDAEEIGLTYAMAGQPFRRLKGRTRDIEQATFREPQQRRQRQQRTPACTRIEVGIKHHDIGAHLSEAENRWLAGAINNWVQQSRRTLPSQSQQDAEQQINAHVQQRWG